MMTFFDSSAVIALTRPGHVFHDWSKAEYASSLANGPVVISDMVYAEVSAGMDDKPSMDAVILRFGFQRTAPSDFALFSAGKRHALYRDNGGTTENVLADFFIGADALEQKAALVTANPKDFRKFFKGLKIVHPKGTEIVK